MWWSGDEEGQHVHVDLRGKEEEHESLSRKLANEWFHLINRERPHLRRGVSKDELEDHKQFVSRLGNWMAGLVTQGLIMVGRDSEGFWSLMWEYLRLQEIEKVLTGRRFAVTKSDRIAIVPREAQQGDIVVFFAAYLVSLVLRKDPESPSQDVEKDIKAALKAKKEEPITSGFGPKERLPDDVEKMPIQKSSFIGECYVEGETSWKRQDDRGRIYTIYALR